MMMMTMMIFMMLTMMIKIYMRMITMLHLWCASDSPSGPGDKGESESDPSSSTTRSFESTAKSFVDDFVTILMIKRNYLGNG